MSGKLTRGSGARCLPRDAGGLLGETVYSPCIVGGASAGAACGRGFALRKSALLHAREAARRSRAVTAAGAAVDVDGFCGAGRGGNAGELAEFPTGSPRQAPAARETGAKELLYAGGNACVQP